MTNYAPTKGHAAAVTKSRLLVLLALMLLCDWCSSTHSTATEETAGKVILIDQNTTWTTSRKIDARIVIFPDTVLRIQGTPTDNILLTYMYDCRPGNNYGSNLNTSIGFALNEGASLIMEHVEVTSTCNDNYGPVIYDYISSDISG